MTHRRHRQAGAALLLAMIVLTLVSTLAAAMVWQQSRAIQVEAAERARAQAGWVLAGGIDWAREIWRRNASDSPTGQQPWDGELAESRLSSFLSADRDNNSDNDLEAFLSGRFIDAQSRYNLRNLITAEGKVSAVELKTLQRLCDAIGLGGTADALAAALAEAWAPAATERAPGTGLAPTRIDDLVWLGIDAATITQLREYADILPQPTPINLNTAPREVIHAVLDGVDLGTAARLVRQSGNRFRAVEDLQTQNLVSPDVKLEPTRVAVTSNHAYVTASVRFEDRALTEVALLQRRGSGGGAEAFVMRSERRPSVVRTP